MLLFHYKFIIVYIALLNIALCVAKLVIIDDLYEHSIEAKEFKIYFLYATWSIGIVFNIAGLLSFKYVIWRYALIWVAASLAVSSLFKIPRIENVYLIDSVVLSSFAALALMAFAVLGKDPRPVEKLKGQWKQLSEAS